MQSRFRHPRAHILCRCSCTRTRTAGGSTHPSSIRARQLSGFCSRRGHCCSCHAPSTGPSRIPALQPVPPLQPTVTLLLLGCCCDSPCSTPRQCQENLLLRFLSIARLSPGPGLVGHGVMQGARDSPVSPMGSDAPNASALDGAAGAGDGLCSPGRTRRAAVDAATSPPVAPVPQDSAWEQATLASPAGHSFSDKLVTN